MNETGPAITAPVSPAAVLPPPVATPGLTFEQQKELLLQLKQVLVAGDGGEAVGREEASSGKDEVRG